MSRTTFLNVILSVLVATTLRRAGICVSLVSITAWQIHCKLHLRRLSVRAYYAPTRRQHSDAAIHLSVSPSVCLFVLYVPISTTVHFMVMVTIEHQ